MVKTGRPRVFDRDKAIFDAMMLFWEQGFESTSLSQLREVMGNISAGSFYTAFESKEKLFKEVIDLYTSTYGQVMLNLTDVLLNPGKAIEMSLRQSAKMQTDRCHPLGCLTVISASTCSLEHMHIRDMLREQRDLIRSWMSNCIRRAVDQGELPASTDINVLTTFFISFLHGISIQARDGVPFETIDAVITQTMSIWDSLR